jgi:fibronectin-binding autotransporter adhesin
MIFETFKGGSNSFTTKTAWSNGIVPTTNTAFTVALGTLAINGAKLDGDIVQVTTGATPTEVDFKGGASIDANSSLFTTTYTTAPPNAAVVSNTSGQFTNAGTMTNNGGLLNVNVGSANTGSTFANSGTFSAGNGTSVSSQTTITVGAQGHLNNSGIIRTNGTSNSLVISDNGTFANSGSIQVNGGVASIGVNSSMTNSGVLDSTNGILTVGIGPNASLKSSGCY